MAENRICITGLRRSKVPAVRAQRAFVEPSPLLPESFSSSPLGLSRRNGIVMIAFPHNPPFANLHSYLRLLSLSVSRNSTLKPHCNVLLHPHERFVRLGAHRRRLATAHFAKVASLVLHLCTEQAARVTRFAGAHSRPAKGGSTSFSGDVCARGKIAARDGTWEPSFAGGEKSRTNVSRRAISPAGALSVARP